MTDGKFLEIFLAMMQGAFTAFVWGGLLIAAAFAIAALMNRYYCIWTWYTKNREDIQALHRKTELMWADFKRREEDQKND